MLLAVLTIVLYVLGGLQVIGGLVGVFVALAGLSEIKRRVAAVPAADRPFQAPAGGVRIEQRKGLMILRRAILALVLGLGVLTVAAWLTVVTVGA